jgi:hypothetical protein
MIGAMPDFMDWIEIVDNVPRLKDGAPEDIRRQYEEYQKAQEEEESVPEEKI